MAFPPVYDSLALTMMQQTWFRVRLIRSSYMNATNRNSHVTAVVHQVHTITVGESTK